MTEIAEMISQALPAASCEPRGAMSAPAAGGKSSKPQSHIRTLLSAGDLDWFGLGQVLCDARKAGDFTHESMAKELCLSQKQIRALECGSAASFPGDTVRSWCARRYAILLGLDWDRLAQSLRSEELDAAIVTTNFPETNQAKPISAGASAQLRMGWLLGAVVLTFITVITISGNG